MDQYNNICLLNKHLDILLREYSKRVLFMIFPLFYFKRKCEQYWNNNLSETFQAGNNMTVVVNQCLGFADYEVRDMTILNVRLYQSYVFVLMYLYIVKIIRDPFLNTLR